MTDTANDPERHDPSQPPDLQDLHADKYNDPRAKITRRGVWMGVGVVLLGIAGSALSIYARRTQLEQTREFWGQETITAFQLGERIEMLSITGPAFEIVELSGTPGLGHLRHALLEERNYDWTTASDDPIVDKCGKDSRCVQLRLTDPTAHRFAPVNIQIDLNSGWIGPSDGSSRVKTTRPAIAKYLETLINVQQLRYDKRK